MNWKAKWIWVKEEKRNDIYVHARKEFDIADLESAELHITSNNRYKFYLNGERIGMGPDRADPDYPFYDTYDITGSLIEGKNVITIDVYCNTSEGDRGRVWCLYGGDPGILAELHIEDKSGSNVIGTDSSWKVIPSPAWHEGRLRISRFQGYIEHFDADGANSIAGFRKAGFDDSDWQDAVELGTPPEGPCGDPREKEIPFLKHVELKPMRIGVFGTEGTSVTADNLLLGNKAYEGDHTVCCIDKNIPVSITYDFGRVAGGYLQLSLKNCSGGTAHIYYGEDDKKLVHEIIELPSNGGLNFESFEWRGTMDATIQFCNIMQPMQIERVVFFDLSYPFDYTSDFESSDPMLGRIWRICRNTAHIATKDHPQDCVGREQALWLSDIVVHTRSNSVFFNELQPMKKAIDQTVRNLTPEGVCAVPGPVSKGYDYDGQELKWSEQPLNIPITIEEIYKHTADSEYAGKWADKIEALMGHFAKYEDNRGLLMAEKEGLQNLSVFTGWCMMLKTGTPLNMNIEYTVALNAAGLIMDKAGRKAEAEKYRAKSTELKAKLVDIFYDQKRHLFIDGEENGQLVKNYSATVNALAVIAGMIPEKEYPFWSEAIAEDNDITPVCSPFDATNMLEAFFIVGRDDLAGKLANDCWGMFVRDGNYTVPEMWLQGRKNNTRLGKNLLVSRCHPYGSGPGYLFINYILGIKPIKPAYKSIHIKPQAMNQASAGGHLDTPNGRIRVSWYKTETEWSLRAEIPEGIKAKVTLPRFAWGAGRLTLNDEVKWETDGWQRFMGDLYRNEQTDFDKEITVELDGGGEHRVVMEAI
ncbi:MAG: alpha-L-rhamnosidase-related protein [Planctomycetota bacterium]|jgi:hypothetical protein